MRILFIILLVNFINVITGGTPNTHQPSYIKEITITQEEKRILDKFRDRVSSKLHQDYMKEDIYLLRWLRATSFNLERAQRMLMDNLRWRKEMGMDNILNEKFPEFEKDYKYSVKGRDKEGKPVIFAVAGDWDYRKAAITNPERFRRYTAKVYEEAAFIVRELGEKYQNVTQAVYLANMNGFNLMQHACLRCIPIFLDIISLYENRYPGLMQQFVIVNAPEFAETFIRIGRGAVSPETGRNLHIYGSNKNVWWPELLKDFTPDQIPIELGGSMYAFDDDDEIDGDENNVGQYIEK